MVFQRNFRLTDATEALPMAIWDFPFKSVDRDQVLPVQMTRLQANAAAMTNSLPCHAADLLIVAHRLRSPVLMKAIKIELAHWRIPRLLMVIKPLDSMLPVEYSVDELKNRGKVYWAVMSAGLWTITSAVARVICNFRGTKQSILKIDYPDDATRVLVLGRTRSSCGLRRDGNSPRRVASGHQRTSPRYQQRSRRIQQEVLPPRRYSFTVRLDANGRRCGSCGQWYTNRV